MFVGMSFAFQGNGNWIWSGFFIGSVLGAALSASVLFSLAPRYFQQIAKSNFRPRLVAAITAVVLLLAWMMFYTFDSMPDPPNTRDGWGGYPPIFLVTAFVSLSAIIILIPVVVCGTLRERCAGALLFFFPFLTFTLLVCWEFRVPFGVVDSAFCEFTMWLYDIVPLPSPRPWDWIPLVADIFCAAVLGASLIYVLTKRHDKPVA